MCMDVYNMQVHMSDPKTGVTGVHDPPNVGATNRTQVL